MFSFKNIERKKKQKKLFENIWWSSVFYFENSSVEVLTQSRSLKIFQEEELEDSEESGDYDNYEGLQAFGGPRGLTVPSQYWQEASIQIETSVAEIYEILESWSFITKWKKERTPNDSV